MVRSGDVQLSAYGILPAAPAPYGLQRGRRSHRSLSYYSLERCDNEISSILGRREEIYVASNVAVMRYNCLKKMGAKLDSTRVGGLQELSMIA